jgi:hypothetical protein
LPVVAQIAERRPAQTIFTRFIPARHPDELPGSWRRYYRRWADLTLERRAFCRAVAIFLLPS